MYQPPHFDSRSFPQSGPTNVPPPPGPLAPHVLSNVHIPGANAPPQSTQFQSLNPHPYPTSYPDNGVRHPPPLQSAHHPDSHPSHQFAPSSHLPFQQHLPPPPRRDTTSPSHHHPVSYASSSSHHLHRDASYQPASASSSQHPPPPPSPPPPPLAAIVSAPTLGSSSGPPAARGKKVKGTPANTRPPAGRHVDSDASQFMDLRRDKLGASDRSYQLIVRQHPEKARLCSFKEENETSDRRPIDPPPVVEIRTNESDPTEFLEATSLFVRVTLINAHPSSSSSSEDEEIAEAGSNHLAGAVVPGGKRRRAKQYTPDDFDVVTSPGGGEATTGEVVLTPEKFKDTSGRMSSFCVFSKLSVRLPGKFRLRMTLYEHVGQQIVKMACVLTAEFEVFSPKQFTGMKESTYLTRHFAHQGLKIKLRTGGPLAATGKTKKQPSPVPSARSHKKKEKKKGKWMAEEDVKEEVPQDEADRDHHRYSVSYSHPAQAQAAQHVPFPRVLPYNNHPQSTGSAAPGQRPHTDLSVFSLSGGSSTYGGPPSSAPWVQLPPPGASAAYPVQPTYVPSGPPPAGPEASHQSANSSQPQSPFRNNQLPALYAHQPASHYAAPRPTSAYDDGARNIDLNLGTYATSYGGAPPNSRGQDGGANNGEASSGDNGQRGGSGGPSRAAYRGPDASPFYDDRSASMAEPASSRQSMSSAPPYSDSTYSYAHQPSSAVSSTFSDHAQQQPPPPHPYQRNSYSSASPAQHQPLYYPSGSQNPYSQSYPPPPSAARRPQQYQPYPQQQPPQPPPYPYHSSQPAYPQHDVQSPYWSSSYPYQPAFPPGNGAAGQYGNPSSPAYALPPQRHASHPTSSLPINPAIPNPYSTAFAEASMDHRRDPTGDRYPGHYPPASQQPSPPVDQRRQSSQQQIRQTFSQSQQSDPPHSPVTDSSHHASHQYSTHQQQPEPSYLPTLHQTTAASLAYRPRKTQSALHDEFGTRDSHGYSHRHEGYSDNNAIPHDRREYRELWDGQRRGGGPGGLVVPSRDDPRGSSGETNGSLGSSSNAAGKTTTESTSGGGMHSVSTDTGKSDSDPNVVNRGSQGGENTWLKREGN